MVVRGCWLAAWKMFPSAKSAVPAAMTRVKERTRITFLKEMIEEALLSET
jgi:hypothetical protein